MYASIMSHNGMASINFQIISESWMLWTEQ